MDNDTSHMTPIQTSTEIGGITPLNGSLDLNNEPLTTPAPAPLESSPPGGVEMPKIDPVPYDIQMECISPLPTASPEGTTPHPDSPLTLNAVEVGGTTPHPDSPLTLEATEAPSHLSTCNMMNGSQLAEKGSATLCQGSCMLKNCAEGHCEMRGDQPTCVCSRCKNGSVVTGNVNIGIGK